MKEAIKNHWPEYLMEAWGLGTFMISAGLFATLLEYPLSPVYKAIPYPAIRMVLMGLVMGLTAIGIIYSPWGKQSGAHINPAVTLTFFRLGKVKFWDAMFYVVFQFLGGVLGVGLVSWFLGAAFSSPPINYVATLPGTDGPSVAFMGEFVISFLLMSTILYATNSSSLAPHTGIIAGMLVALFITFEAPFSGMSMNPARTFASAFPGNIWNAFWIYLTAPPLAMLIAAEIYLRFQQGKKVICAKLHHHNSKRCIFNCGYHQKNQ